MGAFLTDEERSDSQLRTEYAKVRERRLNSGFSSGALTLRAPRLTATEFNDAVRALYKNEPTPLQWVKGAKALHMPCGRCAGTGQFITMLVNNVPTGPGGECFQCNGKGYTTHEDDMRNHVYWTKYARF